MAKAIIKLKSPIATIELEKPINRFEVDIEENTLDVLDYVKVVRCADCVHHKNAPQTTDVWCERIDGLLPKDWFCADGEGREE